MRLRLTKLNQQGSSIVLTLCFTFMLLMICASVIVSSFSAWNAQIRQQEKNIASMYAQGLLRTMKKDITQNPMKPTWRALAQQIYDINNAGGTTPVALTAATLDADVDSIDPWLEDAAAIEMHTFDCVVNIVQEYQAEELYEEVGGQVVNYGKPGVPEIAQVNARLKVKLTVTYHKEIYVIYATFGFTGLAQGLANGPGAGAGTGVISSGTWVLEGYSQG